MAFDWVLSLFALLLTTLLTGAVRKLATSRGLLDFPNTRSSHERATPRGGGISIVLILSAALVILVCRGELDLSLFLAMLVGGIAVALVGFLDDQRSLTPWTRFTVHVAAAIWAAVTLGGLPPLRVGSQILHLGWVGDWLAVLGIVWALNLFNFMDGIDGLAASEAVFVAAAGGGLTYLGGVHSSVLAASLLMAASSLGFLIWNWPPAKIFMGDVGSGYLGFVIAVLAIATTRQDPASLWTWLILTGVFIIDSTVTLVRRLLRGERIYQAHRGHAYQWLARRWRSHTPVTVGVIAVDMFWLLPCAAFAALHPRQATAATAIALAPLVILAFVAGSGRGERSEGAQPEV